MTKALQDRLRLKTPPPVVTAPPPKPKLQPLPDPRSLPRPKKRKIEPGRATEATMEIIAKLESAYGGKLPVVFPRQLNDVILPLAIDSGATLVAKAADPDLMREALKHYCRSTGYLNALAIRHGRYDLFGQPAGITDASHKAFAKMQLDWRKAKYAKKGETEHASVS